MTDAGMIGTGMTDTGMIGSGAGKGADALTAVDRIIDDFAHHRRVHTSPFLRPTRHSCSTMSTTD